MFKESLVEMQLEPEIRYLKTVLIACIRSNGGKLVIRDSDIRTIDRDDELCMFNDYDNHCIVLTSNRAHAHECV